jgi:hypothetical protein
MSPPEDELWVAHQPAAWPNAPAVMTVSTLAEIEACPRRWALLAAKYPALWQGRGYPPRINVAALAGTVVHLTLERITKALVDAGCGSVQDALAPQVMRTLGGYTNIIGDCIQVVLNRIDANPRASHSGDFFARSLRAKTAEMRSRVQTMLSAVRLPNSAEPRADYLAATEPRPPLGNGAYPEVELRAGKLGWKGKADLIVLSSDACEITDFKSGAPDEDHEFQIQVYALLWSLDSDRNPSRRLADRLVLAYSSGAREVPVPTHLELNELERQLAMRGDAAHESVEKRPPEARPQRERCGNCGARQLCGEYWSVHFQKDPRREKPTPFYGDVQLTITGRHGPASWDAVSESSEHFPRGMVVVLRGDNGHIKRGDKVRVLDASISLDPDDETQPALVTLGSLSELYLVPEVPRNF